MTRLKLIFFLCLFSLTLSAGDKKAQEKTFDGEISDSQCGFNVHSVTRSHDEMIKSGYMGHTPADCTRNCIRGRGGQYVFVSSDKKTAYKIEQQELVEPFAGQNVRIQGTEQKGEIHVISIKGR
ncbi:MAG TPA: hypothetical protein VG759_21450 [Candidatus Angelobacter sp.]|jgi:hypothetical protein|nr:hypothetical protein [Candidatus Angelobacter sp.]